MGGGIRTGFRNLRFVNPAADGYVSIMHNFSAASGPYTVRLMHWAHDEGHCDTAMRDVDWLHYGEALVTGAATDEHFDRAKDAVASLTASKTKAELFAEAGAPADVFAVLQGDGAVGAALVNAAVDKVFFTGSVATGRKVAMACAAQLIPCSLELGGSDPAIVLADADVQYAASGIAWTRFSNAGQTCVAPKRVYVEAPAYEAFVAALSDTVRNLRVGSGESAETEVTAVIQIGRAHV